jgi:hypothetical protein
MSVGPAADLAPLQDPLLPAPTATAAALQQVADAVRSGDCTLFLGAGVHSLPPPDSPFTYVAADAPPRGAELAKTLAAQCGVDASVLGDLTDLRRIALYYERVAHDRGRLMRALFAAVQENRKPSPMLRALAQLPFRFVITTNYDNLFERALIQAGKDPEVSVYTVARRNPRPPSRGVGEQRPFVLKIHGDFTREGAGPDDQSVVITEEDYITFVLRMRDADELNPVPLAIRAQLARNPTLFVGYSLNDYNLRILFRALRYSADWGGLPSSFSVDPRPNPIIRKLLTTEYQIIFLAEDLWAFVPTLYQAVLGTALAP